MLRMVLINLMGLTLTSAVYASNNCKQVAENYFRNQGYQIESASVVSRDANKVVIKVRSNYYGGQGEDLVTLDSNCRILDVTNVWAE